MTEQQEKQIYSQYVNTHDNLYDIAKRAGVPYTEARNYIFNAFDENYRLNRQEDPSIEESAEAEHTAEQPERHKKNRKHKQPGPSEEKQAAAEPAEPHDIPPEPPEQKEPSRYQIIAAHLVQISLQLKAIEEEFENYKREKEESLIIAHEAIEAAKEEAAKAERQRILNLINIKEN